MMAHAENSMGHHMATEIAQAPDVFVRAVSIDCQQMVGELGLAGKRAIYTVARGSSDAAANTLSYEFMRELSIPVTSLPPSVFSLGVGVRMRDAAALVISQSGASDDLVKTAKGIRGQGGAVVAITNVPGSAVEAASDATVHIGAGPELAVPATKTVIGSIAAGMALLSTLSPDYAARAAVSAANFAQAAAKPHPQTAALHLALTHNPHVYVIGRDAGFGAAHEIALKIKETCAIHAEAYSGSEVLHGPLQLATRPLLVLILDTGQKAIQESLDLAEHRFASAGGTVIRLRPADVGAKNLTPAAAAALLLCLVYPIILSVAVALGLDPDTPETLSKVTMTT